MSHYSYIQDKYDGNVIQYIDDKRDYMESMEYKDGWLIYDSSIDQLYYLRLMYSAYHYIFFIYVDKIITNMKAAKKELGQIVTVINKDQWSLYLLNIVIKKLRKLGYVLDDEHIEKELQCDYDFFFLHIDKDIKHAFIDSSILIPSCMANIKRSPISIKWMNSKFAWIMSNKTTAQDLKNLEKKAYKAIK